MKDPKDLELEKKLIEDAKKDHKRFLELYDKYYDQIYRYIHRRVNGDPDTTHDLASDTFLDALKNLENYKWMGYPFSSWLYKIAHNNVIKWYRKQGKVRQVSLENAHGLSDTREDQKEDLEKKMIAQQVEKMMNSLDEEEQEILRLKFFEGVSNVEIANIMELSVSNIGVKVFRTLKKAKGLLPTKNDLKKITNPKKS